MVIIQLIITKEMIWEFESGNEIKWSFKDAVRVKGKFKQVLY